MTKALFFQAIFKFSLGVLITGALLFLPAGTLRYWNAWLLMLLLFVPMFLAGIFLMFKNPDLLRKRLNARERQAQQRNVIVWSAIMFIAGFAAAGLNFRFAWIQMSDWISWVGAVVFLLAYLLYGEVLRENAFLSRTIEIQENQRVIDTGLYGVVRHPMYAAAMLLFLSIPLVLNSPLTFLIFLIYPVLIVLRIGNEEHVLEAGLDGYSAYQQRVKYRIFPFIW